MLISRVYRKSRTVNGIISETVKPIIVLLLLIFLWRRYSDIENLFNRIFRQEPNFYKGSVSELPNDKNFYKEFVKDLVQGINGFSPFDREIYNLLNLSPLELQYVNDIYLNPQYPIETLAQSVKGDTYDDPALRILISKHFKKAGIPF